MGQGRAAGLTCKEGLNPISELGEGFFFFSSFGSLSCWPRMLGY